MSMAWAVLEGKLDLADELSKRIYACTTCGYCSARCGMDVVRVIEAFRTDLIGVGKGMPEHKRFREHVLKEYNPYLELHQDRLNWLPKDIKLAEKAGILYFVGCTSSYRQKNIALSTAKILRDMNVDFTVLRDEWCCGSPLLRTGQTEHVAELGAHNVKLAEELGTDVLVTSCAGCYRVWKKDYKDLGVDYDFKVVHITELLHEMIKKGELKFKGEFKKRIMYHDPCHLGRHMGVYDPPRQVLMNIHGVELIETERSRDLSFCCGAGGGVKSAFPDFALKASLERLKEAVRAGVKAIVSACPFCWRNFHDAAEKHQIDLGVYDVVEIVSEVI